MFKKSLIAATVAATVGVPGLASAQQAAAPAAEQSPHTLTGNVGFFSQYIFRGMTQTDRQPALQGGFDYSHASGLYLGTWASNISWLKENASSAAGGTAGTYKDGGSLEWDFYGGYKSNFGSSDFFYDVGALYYWYPGKVQTNPALAGGNALNVKANTLEGYGALGWKWLSAKYSYSLLDRTFGTRDSKGTWYLDLSANVPLGDFAKGLDGLTLIAHWGWQKYTGTDPRNGNITGTTRRIDNDDLFSYKDIKLGLSYALPASFTVGAFYSKGINYNKSGYGSFNDRGTAGAGVNPHDMLKSTATVFVQKTF